MKFTVEFTVEVPDHIATFMGPGNTAGSLAAKKHVPTSAGTLPTHTPLFIVLLASTVIVIGALTFLPALALGPIAEQLSALGH